MGYGLHSAGAVDRVGNIGQWSGEESDGAWATDFTY